MGVVHQVPFHNYTFSDLSRLLSMPEWNDSIPHCRGLFVLCEYVREFLRERGVTLPISKIPYPQETNVPVFSFECFSSSELKTIMHVGIYLRNYQAFYDLSAPGYRKRLLTYPEVDKYLDKVRRNNSVQTVPYVDDMAYDELLTHCLVFLNLFDADAITTVLECIVRATPIIVNKVGALTEYLGDDYPGFYKNLDDASDLLTDSERIFAAHSHLRRLPLRKRLGFDRFVTEFKRTAVYRGLPKSRPSVANQDES